MNQTQSPTAPELLGVFVLAMFFLLSCSTATQQTIENTPPPLSTANADVTASKVSLAPAVPLPPPENWRIMPARPFDEALLNSLGSLLSLVELPAPGAKQILIVDPITDGISGVQSVATRRIEARLADLTRKKYPHFAVRPLTDRLDASAVLLFGTLTPVNAIGYPEGKREVYRMCLALADLDSRRIVLKEVSKVQMKGVDNTPTPYFVESPAWISEEGTKVHAQACEAGKTGDLIPQQYLDGMALGALVNQAISDYEAGRYKQALERYASAATGRMSEDPRVRNGLYLTNIKLGRAEAAAAAFEKIVELGMAREKFAMNFLFKAGSASFPPDKRAYSSWTREIARRATQSGSCLEIVGHTSASGPEALNERLSLQRADYIKKLLEAESGELTGRITALGAGSKENLVGTGKDDLSDALDRRIAFRFVSCSRLETQTAHR